MAAVCGVVLVPPHPAWAQGSADLYPGSPAPTCAPASASGSCRANIEWRTSSYGPVSGTRIPRRDLFYVYLTKGQILLMGSSAVGVTSGATEGDVVVYDPGVITSYDESPLPALVTTGPGANGFSCDAQRATSGVATQGQLTTRVQELAGPQAVTGGGNPTGYVPCWYAAPSAGFYNVAFFGPDGSGTDVDGTVGADIGLTNPDDTDAAQGSSVAAWDLTVRDSTTTTTDDTGRVFLYAYDAFTGGNGLPVDSSLYVTTLDGFRYRTDLRGLDPNGFMLYGNDEGFLDPDGSILDHDVEGTTNSGQLTALAGGTMLAPPQYPISFSPLAPVTLAALGIPAAAALGHFGAFSFAGSSSGDTSLVDEGGTFHFSSNAVADYQIVISQTPGNFDPTLTTSRVLRGVARPGANVVSWDGEDNTGTPFPVGRGYQVDIQSQSGVYHFPLLDAENSTAGGPTITLQNPPGGVCPFANPKCTTAFYDDRGYHASGPGGGDVGTIGTVLCGVDPPAVPASNPIDGFDSSSDQRAYGQDTGGNANVPCQNGGTGSFGDVKGLDLWAYYPGNDARALLNVVAPAPGIALVKAAHVTDTNHDGRTDAGDVITWTFRVTNTGTVALSDVAVDDPEAGAVTCPLSTLAPQASETCTAVAGHTVTQADVDAGVVDNTATARGTPPGAPTPIVSAPSSTVTPVAQDPALRILKVASVRDANHDGRTDAGDVITWSFLVANTGNLPLTDVGVNDPGAGPVTCPSSVLAPGAAEVCTADAGHTVTTSDETNGAVDNTATVSGRAPSGTVITSPPSSTHTTVDRPPAGAGPPGRRAPPSPPPSDPPSPPLAALPPALAFTGAGALAVLIPSGLTLEAAGAVVLFTGRRRGRRRAPG